MIKGYSGDALTAETGVASSDIKQSRPLRTLQEHADNPHPTLQG
jgi:hypothetical protein